MKVCADIHKDFVNGIYMYVLRGNIFEVYLIDSGAVFHVKGHAGRCNDIRNRVIRVFLYFVCKIGFPGKRMIRDVVLPLAVNFPDFLYHLKQPCPARNTELF